MHPALPWWAYLSQRGYAEDEAVFFEGWGEGVNGSPLTDCPPMDFRLGYDVGVMWRKNLLLALDRADRGSIL